jgi:hypothetical protein
VTLTYEQHVTHLLGKAPQHLALLRQAAPIGVPDDQRTVALRALNADFLRERGEEMGRKGAARYFRERATGAVALVTWSLANAARLAESFETMKKEGVSDAAIEVISAAYVKAFVDAMVSDSLPARRPKTHLHLIK